MSRTPICLIFFEPPSCSSILSLKFAAKLPNEVSSTGFIQPKQPPTNQGSFDYLFFLGGIKQAAHLWSFWGISRKTCALFGLVSYFMTLEKIRRKLQKVPYSPIHVIWKYLITDRFFRDTSAELSESDKICLELFPGQTKSTKTKRFFLGGLRVTSVCWVWYPLLMCFLWCFWFLWVLNLIQLGEIPK